MLRRAVVIHLKNNVPALGGRVYDAFLAPPNPGRPYATVKLPTIRGSPHVSFAGTQPVEVRILDDPAGFGTLDQLERAVIAALHGVTITDATEDPPAEYVCHWEPGGGDFYEDDKKLIGRLVIFEAAAIWG